MTEGKKRLLLVVGSVGLTLLGGELAIRTLDLIRGRGFNADARNLVANPRPLIPFRTFGLVPYDDVDGTLVIASRHGEHFPLQKEPGTTRIVVFGGSTSENQKLVEEHKSHYPKILQENLRQRAGHEAIEVISVANTAYATPHSLILLELDVLSWDPDIVILSHNINDLIAGYFPGSAFNYANKYGHEFYGLPNLRSRFSLSNVVFQHSQLYWVVQDRIRRFQLAHDSRFTIHRVSYGEAPAAAARQAFVRNLRSFVALARLRGIEVILGTQPLEPSEEFFRLHMGVKPYNDTVRYPLHEEFLAHHASYNRALAEVALEEGALLADNAAALGGQSEFFVDFVHHTLPGAQRLAEGFADLILAEGLVPAPTAIDGPGPPPG